MPFTYDFVECVSVYAYIQGKMKQFYFIRFKFKGSLKFTYKLLIEMQCLVPFYCTGQPSQQ